MTGYTEAEDMYKRFESEWRDTEVVAMMALTQAVLEQTNAIDRVASALEESNGE